MLASGTRLGPYEIVAPLGAGGMGEVYRARDTRLSRDVAVKVLPQHLSREPEVRARFEREARTISSLNHAHICVLHDVGREGDTDYLVMELVEGETLSKRLTRGALPLAEVLRLGSQVADALARAHRAGVVHRDLKPGNIMVTKSGAKLMDFGLARSSRNAPNAEELTQAPTETSPITGEGRILGTVPYMAPEQFEGREADARTDIWALGCVLYEMATGVRAFGGGSAASVMSAILRDEPAPLTARSPASPAGLERLIRSCLAKDPNERWQSAGDLARELGWVAGGGEVVGKAVTARRGVGLWLVLAALVAIALAAALLLTGRAPWNAAPQSRTWTTLELPAWVNGESFFNGNFALSPDGNRVALVLADSSVIGQASTAALGRLFVRALSGHELVPLIPDEEVFGPFWSPDSREIGFLNAQGKLERVNASGGAPQFICKPTPGPVGCSWSRNGWIVFGVDGGGPLMKVRASGGAPEPATALDTTRRERGHAWPEFLPDGRHFLFSVQSPDTRGYAGIRVGSLDETGSHSLMIANGTPQCDGRGNIVFLRDGVLYRQGIDDHGDRLRGEPAPLEQEPSRYVGWAGMPVARVAGDRLICIPADKRPTDFVWFQRDGLRLERSVQASKPLVLPGLSPDGRRVVAVLNTASMLRSLWSLDLATGAERELTDRDEYSRSPIWSASGRHIAYSAVRLKKWELQLMDPAVPESTRAVGEAGFPTCFVPGDRQVVLTRPTAAAGPSVANYDIMVHELIGAAPDLGYATSPANETDCVLFDGGHHAAFISDASGRWEIYCDDFPIRRHTVQLTSDGCLPSRPWYNRFWVAGSELFYISASGNTMRAMTLRREGDSFVRGEARTLFDLPLDNRGLAPSPDGQRFLMALPAGGFRPVSLTFVDNWDASPAAR